MPESALADGPVVLVGCGRLGAAILEGWLLTGAVAPSDLMILSPSRKPAAEAARAKGARVNPPLEALTAARAVVLAVKPALWRQVMAPLTPFLHDQAVIVSVMAGVTAPTLAEGLGGWPIVRVMPTTGVARGRGVASVWAADAAARALGRALFEPMAETVDLADEDLMDAATAVAGSGAAYFYAFTQALAEAGAKAGLDAATAETLARATLKSAADAMGDEALDALIARIASPGGSTRAGLESMQSDGRLTAMLEDTVAAAVRRNREMGA
ncbi:pyrroline-5-carboxylate reductase [Brevundimonas sp. SORGH_AS_0993]|uniref:pyrroline-5-carboxylate reductase family protein n=1 Tax=Brevundimonas sp. SORGH_AS_0993 TaxID=3041794 RepID=UPI002784D7B6|nr:pyrroline-5-carboxylate reductase dimerization domain-containing protein [Brevundimonas sp. SORGH_AS_0993]MDQ1154107.1 pyrroline-5-carboxylate reductase [Brevundimonas sp. SORGH_AS_0993]